MLRLGVCRESVEGWTKGDTTCEQDTFIVQMNTESKSKRYELQI